MNGRTSQLENQVKAIWKFAGLIC